LLSAYPRFQIPLNPPFLKGEISHNDLDGTTIKATKIYKSGGLEIKGTLRKCQQENEGCRKKVPGMPEWRNADISISLFCRKNQL